MYMNKKLFLFLGLFCFTNHILSQAIQPGFDAREYRELMLLNVLTGSDSDTSAYAKKFEKPKLFKMIYRSPVMGLDNLWDHWERDGKVDAISIRGTTRNAVSWLANFYAAMIPGKGSITLNDSSNFTYKFAEHPRAAVHVGWTIATGYLYQDILPRIRERYRQGIHDFLIIGHSQGGAISYLLTAQLRYAQQQGDIPADIRFKTYCSAAPKPGNLFFAYDYEANIPEGWAYNVVNAADWVPETPFSVQTVSDFNQPNPFAGMDTALKKQKLITRLVVKYVYDRLNNPTIRSKRRFKKYLGKKAAGFVKKNLKGFKEPEYVHSTNYVRAGATIVLMPDEPYNAKYPSDNNNAFIHHLHDPYLLLLEKLEKPIMRAKLGQNSTP